MERKIFLKPPHYFFFCLVLSVALYSIFPSVNFIRYPWSLAGLLLMVKGLAFVLISWALFKKYKTPEGFQKSTNLVTKGLYRYSRNPMYLGGIIFLTGMSIILGNVISFVSPVLFFLVVNFMFIPYEEEKAEREFDLEYLEYKKRTRRWF